MTSASAQPSEPRSDKRSERREQILEGLFEAMATSGTRGTSITEIATAAGIARGALHYYFTSKEEIRLKLMERLGERYVQGLSAHLDRHASQPQRMCEALVRYHLGPEDDALTRMLSVWIDFWGNAPTDDDLRNVVLEVQERAREQCWRVIETVRPELAEVPRAQARLHAAALLALIEGSILQWRIAVHSSQPLDRRLLLQQIGLAAWALCRALGPTEPDSSTGGPIPPGGAP